MADQQLLIFIFSVIGGFGLFSIVISLSGLGKSLLPSLYSSNKLARLGRENDSVLELPITARIGKTFSSFGKQGTADENNEKLMARLLRSGLAYRSPAHYYKNQLMGTLIYGLMFGVGGSLALSAVIGFDIPASTMILVSLGMGYYGGTVPASEVKEALQKRRKDIIIDMAFSLKRLSLHLEALGSIQIAIEETLKSERRIEVNPEDLEKINEDMRYVSEEYKILLGQSLTGLGGNLFAEALNRLSSYLAQNYSVEEAIEKTSQFYPRVPELDNFLNIVAGGIAGKLSMKGRIDEMIVEIREALVSEIEDNVEKAKLLVVGLSAASLIAIFAVIGAPIAQLALDLF